MKRKDSMKKSLIKITVFILTFLVALVVIGKIMNKGHDNLTVDIASATYPIVTMERNGIAYNQLHGYKTMMDTAFQRDSITVLGENRDAGIRIDTYGQNVTGINMEVRTTDGSRLIENSPITEYETERGSIRATISLKDLIEPDTEYSLAIVLELDGEHQIRYYTRAIWSTNYYLDEKMEYIRDFHERLYDREAAKALTKYLETDSRLESNTSFHKVNIHSSFKQLTWGDMTVKEVGEPVITLKEISASTASFLIDYTVNISETNKPQYCAVQEYFRVRYTPERMYLLNYEREMTQIPDTERMYANDKILLGIADENVPMLESEDGNIVVFTAAGRLYSYNGTTNKLAEVFSFYDAKNADPRTLNDEHGIKILDVDEGGNIYFAVYGYMNRGRHEGEVGIQVYVYDSTLNTLEEAVYVPYDKPYSVLHAEIEQLMYFNRQGQLYLLLENTVYCIDLDSKSANVLVSVLRDGSLQVSENHKIIVWQDGTDIYHCQRLEIRDLGRETRNLIEVAEGESVRPLGFIGEDLIFGVAREGDIRREDSGNIFFPMYKICICNSDGELLKNYSMDGVYVVDCRVEGNQITLDRVSIDENGTYKSLLQDHIMNNTETVVGKNMVVVANIDIYERYVQIQVRNTIDSKSLKILNPKEVMFEGDRNLTLVSENDVQRYYVYGPYGVEGVYNSPASAVELAYGIAGVVVNRSGDYVWMKSNRVSRNQIMAITENSVTEEKDSLAVCLDTMLKYEGVIRNSEYLLARGQSVLEILAENLPDAEVLDLTGCGLDALLYYVNMDIPILALLDNGEAVLVTGFNEKQIVIMDPISGTLYKKNMTDAAEWFTENGNCFVTYIYKD